MASSVFVLSWQPTIRDYEAAQRAKRRATRVVWIERGIGGLLAAVSVPGAIQGDPVSVFFVLLGIGLTVDVYGRFHRWFFGYRRHPSAFVPTTATLDAEGVHETDGHAELRLEWAHWKAMLHLDDRLVLMTATGGNCGLMGLPRRALADPGQWPDLVSLVEEHVPDHPRDPHPRRTVAAAG